MDRGVNPEEFLQDQGRRLAIEGGRFSRNNDVYSQSNFLIGDGTVLKSASSKPPLEYVDVVTGEIRQRRTDFGSLLHTEGGGDTVHGAKFLPVWSTGEDHHDTICMGETHVDSTAPAVEGQRGGKLADTIQHRLFKDNSCASLLAYDRAAGWKEQEALNDIGMVLATRAFVDNDEDSKSHYRKPKSIGHVSALCGTTHYFVAIQKRLHQVIKDVGGKSEYISLPHLQRPKSTGGRIFHYTEHPYECSCEIGATHILRISWNGRKSALASSKNSIELAGDKGYDNMLRYLQPHAPDSDEFKEIIGNRQTAEAMHSIMDQMLPFKRLQRWTLESKESWVFGYLIGHNLVHQQLRRERIPDELAA
jgi:hypothetical protein